MSTDANFIPQIPTVADGDFLTSQSRESDRTTGAIRKLKDGYGFIAGDDGIDYFFHWSAMEIASKNFRDLSVQERVSFHTAVNTVKGEQKFRAICIRVI